MFQQLILIGRLGRDPEMRYTPSGQAVSSFNLAVDDVRKGADGNTEKKTYWFRITAWGRQAETVSQYLKKGRLVMVIGRLEGDPATGGPKIWTRQDGTAGASFEVTASTVKFLERASDVDAAVAEAVQGSFADVGDAGDIPF